MMRASVIVVVISVLLGVATCAQHSLPIRVSQSTDNLPNISAVYECSDDTCTSGCTAASIPQGACFWVPPAMSYVIYRCINNSAQVHLQVYGPLKYLCEHQSKLHLSYTYDVDTCVLPKAGGYTQYHCN